MKGEAASMDEAEKVYWKLEPGRREGKSTERREGERLRL
jgi:hypothetical protein